MKRWTDRPREIRNLFNPAFCGIVILRGIDAYETDARRGMPFSLTLLILPMCLHKESRDAIVKSNRAYFTKLVDQNPQIIVGFSERTRNLIPYTFEALGFLHQLGVILVEDDGSIRVTPKSIAITIKGTDESKACQRAARTLGRRFAAIRDRVTVYTTLGVKP